MSDAYLDWEELVGTSPARHDTAPPPPTSEDPDLEALLELDGVPDELRALVERRLQLRQQLDAFGGAAPREQVDARDATRFEVPVHTAETRIAERRERRRDEHAHLTRLRRQQQRLLARQRDGAEAEDRRRGRAERVAARRRAEHDERQAAEAERRRRQAESVQHRWEDDRRESAEQWRAATRRRLQWEGQRQQHRAAASIARVLQRRDEQHRLEARLDNREVPWELARDRRRDARREARP